MKINRVTVVLVSTFLALIAATGVAAASGGNDAHSQNGKNSPVQVGNFTPWHSKPTPVHVQYRPHVMCDELNHGAMYDQRS